MASCETTRIKLLYGLKIQSETLNFYVLCLISFIDSSCRVSRIMHSHTLWGNPSCECRMTSLSNVIDIIDCVDIDSSFVCRIVAPKSTSMQLAFVTSEEIFRRLQGDFQTWRLCQLCWNALWVTLMTTHNYVELQIAHQHCSSRGETPCQECDEFRAFFSLGQGVLKTRSLSDANWRLWEVGVLKRERY